MPGARGSGPEGLTQYDINVSYRFDVDNVAAKSPTRVAVPRPTPACSKRNIEHAVRGSPSTMCTRPMLMCLSCGEMRPYVRGRASKGSPRSAMLPIKLLCLERGHRRGDVRRRLPVARAEEEASRIATARRQRATSTNGKRTTRLALSFTHRPSLRRLSPARHDSRPRSAAATYWRSSGRARTRRSAPCRRPGCLGPPDMPQENVRLQLANRYSDIYSALSTVHIPEQRAVWHQEWLRRGRPGVTVPLPVYNRNQGSILRVQWNVT